MNICTRNCKYYEHCLLLRYNNCRKDYMKEVEVEYTRDNIAVIYVKKCSKYQRTSFFTESIGVGIRNERHSQKQKMAREKKTNIKAR